ncbi:MAG TPA: SCP2 sterol-binding domain-containing protein, partial [Candidatus Lokiarchaeia archaeon]|nr:SCP2 sterol-binding domain-containing protein [Candidatus Lokiarchaeia archaeon]
MVTMQDGFDFMASVFNAEEAANFKRKVVLQYNVAGDGGGQWQMILENGGYRIEEGTPETPQVEMNYDSVESFVGVTTGDIGGMKAYLTGKMRFQGPRPLLEQV